MKYWHPARVLARTLHYEVYITRNCEMCKEMYRVRLCRAATAYAEPSRNKSLWLCEYCEEDYYEYWSEMWADYYNMVRP